MLLDQYGAADVIIPTVYLERRWPGGPVVGRFFAYHGPDGEELARFTLSVRSDDALDKLLDEGVRRIDEAYAQALRDGQLHTDRSLAIEAPPPLELAPVVDSGAGEGTASLVVQVDTVEASALSQAEAAFAGLPGVQTTIGSLAIGGISSLRVSYSGGIAGLRFLLDQRGWRLDDVAGGVRLRRRTAQDAPLPAPPPSPTPATTAAKPAPAVAAKPTQAKPAAVKPPAKPATATKSTATKSTGSKVTGTKGQ
jgi:hypothetical protein